MVVCLDAFNSKRAGRSATPAPSRNAARAVVFRAASPETEGDDTDFEVDSPLEEAQVRVVRTFPKTRVSRVPQARPVALVSRPTPTLLIRFKAKEGRPFTFGVCPDTGATRTIASADIARRFKLPVDKYGKEYLRAANQGQMDCIGSVILRSPLMVSQSHSTLLFHETFRMRYWFLGMTSLT